MLMAPDALSVTSPIAYSARSPTSAPAATPHIPSVHSEVHAIYATPPTALLVPTRPMSAPPAPAPTLPSVATASSATSPGAHCARLITHAPLASQVILPKEGLFASAATCSSALPAVPTTSATSATAAPI